MQQNEQITGTVEKLIYRNDENGFSVFVLLFATSKSTTVKGYVPAVQPGEQVTIKGMWVMHPKFGKQFEAQSCTAQVPTSIIGLKKYLGSGLIKGIGPVYAEKLVSYFGQSVLEVIDKQPDRLQEVPGIGPKRIERIVLGWQDQKEISHIMVFLQDKGISPAYATKIYKKYGAESISVLSQNPYRLADEIWGIGFKTADTIAQNMGFEPRSQKRIKSGLLFALSTFVNNGHLYAEIQQLKEHAFKLLELERDDELEHTMKLAMHELHNEEKIKVITHQEQHFIGHSKHYFCEKGVASKIQKLQTYPAKQNFDIDKIYHELRTANDAIQLNEDQQKGILSCLQNKVSIITGGPGTGKTTLIKKLLSFLDAHKQVYRLAAPTGRAAKRITEGTGRNACTLHRLLEFDVSTMGFARNEQNALALDFLIIDEASMIDIFLGYALLKAVPLTAHVVFIGDIDQLPSVGAGNFLNDLIASQAVPTVRLTQIFRQAQNSMIIINAHRINNGEFPTSFLPDTRRDFLYIKEKNPENVPAHLQNIYINGLKKFNIKAEDAIVLVPMNRGSVGTIKINYDLQQILNPSDTQKRVMHHGTTFKIGDRVMQIRNNYDKLVFNGDIGYIDTIDLVDKMLVVRYLDRPVEYDFSELDELVLAYAISIHKSQGSEFAAAIVPVFMQHFTLLQRNLIYTAITRAKKLCIFMGEPRAIAMAIKNNKGLVRTTFLKEFLTTDLEGR